MAEYITKEQAIDLVKSLEVVLGCLGVSVLVREIERLETVEPARNERVLCRVLCSSCHHLAIVDENMEELVCPYCGAKVEKEE